MQSPQRLDQPNEQAQIQAEINELVAKAKEVEGEFAENHPHYYPEHLKEDRRPIYDEQANELKEAWLEVQDRIKPLRDRLKELIQAKPKRKKRPSKGARKARRREKTAQRNAEANREVQKTAEKRGREKAAQKAADQKAQEKANQKAHRNNNFWNSPARSRVPSDEEIAEKRKKKAKEIDEKYGLDLKTYESLWNPKKFPKNASDWEVLKKLPTGEEVIMDGDQDDIRKSVALTDSNGIILKNFGSYEAAIRYYLTLIER